MEEKCWTDGVVKESQINHEKAAKSCFFVWEVMTAKFKTYCIFL